VTSTFILAAILAAAAVAGLAIFAGLYLGDPGKGLRGGIITVAIVTIAAVILGLLR